jgi:hypothetical protein
MERRVWDMDMDMGQRGRKKTIGEKGYKQKRETTGKQLTEYGEQDAHCG